MKNKMKLLFVLLTVSTGVLANDAGILRCRGIIDSTARLACYDALSVTVVEPKAVASKPAVQAEPRPAPAVAATSAPAMPSPAPIAAVASASPSAPQKSDQFGLENRTSPATLDAIESTIPGRFEGWDAKSMIKLANGQVWQIADDSNRYLTLTDPKVRIRRGALGAFYLEFEKINHSPRVRRVQ
ncbi:MAG: hypothetical protein IPP88_25105 [Betaproteobacteria bacterium]|nr:hypothetical protein [Betaproteobacteria bacterium]